MAQAIRTIDHEEIREWIEAHGGMPAVVEGTHSEGSGILRVDFGAPEDNLEAISWEEFFRIFDENDLAFVYQADTDGAESYFSKFVARQDDSDVGGQDLDASDMGVSDDL